MEYDQPFAFFRVGHRGDRCPKALFRMPDQRGQGFFDADVGHHFAPDFRKPSFRVR